MFGRFGSIAGSNFVAFFLDNHCESAFLVPSTILISKFIIILVNFMISKKNFNFMFTVCGVLAFFIPKVREIPKTKELGLEPRISVSSRIN